MQECLASMPKDLSIQAYEGMWLSNIFFLPIALLLIYKAKNDSELFTVVKINPFLITQKK